MNLKKLTLALLAIITIQSCDNSDAYFGSEGPDPELPTFNRLADIIKFENVLTDSLAFNPLEDAEVEGTFGTKIFIPQNSFVGGGVVDSIADSLYVVLREYPTLTKMGIGNVQTISDQELLVTGGNFWWKVVDDEGNDYELATSSNIRAEQPIGLDMGAYAPLARYYKGEVVQAGNQEVINWSLGSNAETFMNAENNLFTYYGIDLGWVNCDALYDYPGDKTQFKVLLNAESTLQETEQMVLFIINDFPSIVNLTTRDGDYFTSYDNSIPVGITGTLVAIALDNQSNVLLGSTSVTISGDDDFEVDMTAGSIQEITDLLNQASN